MKSAIIIILSIFIISMIACDSINTTGKDIVFPDENVSFQNHVYPFLKINCSYSGCHSDETQAGGVILTYYSSLFMSPGMVILDDPDKSRLIQIVEGKLPHLSYFYKGNITENHKIGLRLWILEGAKNN